jgi:hypothetical protein
MCIQSCRAHFIAASECVCYIRDNRFCQGGYIRANRVGTLLRACFVFLYTGRFFCSKTMLLLSCPPLRLRLSLFRRSLSLRPSWSHRHFARQPLFPSELLSSMCAHSLLHQVGRGRHALKKIDLRGRGWRQGHLLWCYAWGPPSIASPQLGVRLSPRRGWTAPVISLTIIAKVRELSIRLSKEARSSLALERGRASPRRSQRTEIRRRAGRKGGGEAMVPTYTCCPLRADSGCWLEVK